MRFAKFAVNYGSGRERREQIFLHESRKSGGGTRMHRNKIEVSKLARDRSCQQEVTRDTNSCPEEHLHFERRYVVALCSADAIYIVYNIYIYIYYSQIQIDSEINLCTRESSALSKGERSIFGSRV